jgi:hypothetical protein
MGISFGRWGCLRIGTAERHSLGRGVGTAERHSLERGVGSAFVSQFALEQHDLVDRERIALRERNLFERRHGAITDPAKRQVRPERARLRLETGWLREEWRA